MNLNNNTVNELAHFEFYGDKILIARDSAGAGWVPLRQLCDLLVLNFGSQQTKLKADPRFSCTDISTTGADGKNYSMLCLRIDEVHYWLSSINPNKLVQRDGETAEALEERRARLITYQRECGEALRDYWMQGFALNRRERAVSMKVEAPKRDLRTKSRSSLIAATKRFRDYTKGRGHPVDVDDFYHGILNLISNRVLGRKLHHEDEAMSGADQQWFSTMERVVSTCLLHYVAWEKDPVDMLNKIDGHLEKYLEDHPTPLADADPVSASLFSDGHQLVV